MLNYFSTYSPPEFRYLSYSGTNFYILSRWSMAPGIGTTVALISASLSFWKSWHWPDRNFLRCKKRWTGREVRDIGRMINISQSNSCRRCIDRRAVCDYRPGIADDEFRSARCSMHSKTLSLTELNFQRVLEWKPPTSNAATMLLRELGKSHYATSFITYTQSLHTINGVKTVVRGGNLICGRPS